MPAGVSPATVPAVHEQLATSADPRAVNLGPRGTSVYPRPRSSRTRGGRGSSAAVPPWPSTPRARSARGPRAPRDRPSPRGRPHGTRRKVVGITARAARECGARIAKGVKEVSVSVGAGAAASELREGLPLEGAAGRA
eukprot:3940035-Rhodomonas_salina.2